MMRDAHTSSASEPNTSAQPPVIVVSGLPRSGTSMMMKMLEAGGAAVMVDNLRTPDNDNPEGYYELERVKQLDKGDKAWVAEASGKVIKVISALLEFLPPDQSYQVLFMQRQIEEVLASQQKMLSRRGETGAQISDAQMAQLFARHVAGIRAWLAAQHNFSVIEVDYNGLLADPAPQVHAITEFLDVGLDAGKMMAVVKPDLYRNRAGASAA